MSITIIAPYGRRIKICPHRKEMFSGAAYRAPAAEIRKVMRLAGRPSMQQFGFSANRIAYMREWVSFASGDGGLPPFELLRDALWMVGPAKFCLGYSLEQTARALEIPEKAFLIAIAVAHSDQCGEEVANYLYETAE